MFFFSALVIGFLGSFHCVSMCGPIALTLPLSSKKISGRLFYNGGRIVTYAVLGLLFGLAGHTLVIAGFEKSLSIISGVMILLVAFISIFSNKILLFNRLLTQFTGKLKQAFKVLFGKRSLLSFFFIGAVNGLLPCGFVYLALAGAASSGRGNDGLLYMAMFGLGTLPMMFSLSMAGQIFGFRFQSLIRKASPWIAAVLAVFLIYRGVSFPVKGCCHH